MVGDVEGSMGCVTGKSQAARSGFPRYTASIFLQRALLAAKSDAQRPKTRIGPSELQIATEYISNTSRGALSVSFNRRCMLCSLIQ